jgi:hypothetical protein
VANLVLILPDLFLPAAPSGAGAELVRLRLGSSEDVKGGWRRWFAERIGQPELARLPAATVIAAAMAYPSPPTDDSESESHWIATPLALDAALDHVRVPHDAVLTLARGEAWALADDFNALLGGDAQLTLQPVASDAFLLRGLASGPAQSRDPARLLGTRLDGIGASGPGASALRRLMGEIELWLHDHPVNRARVADGLRAVSTLWLWGGADGPVRAVPQGWRLRSGPASDIVVCSDDAWVQAVCRIAGVACSRVVDAPTEMHAMRASTVVIVAAVNRIGDEIDVQGESALQCFENAVLGPSIGRLERRRLRSLTMLANDRILRFGRADRWRLWRARRPWSAAIASGPAA